VASFIAAATVMYPEYLVDAAVSGPLLIAVFKPKTGGPPLTFTL
jgi:hypothetical protein